MVRTVRFDPGFDAGHLERLSQGAEGGALYSTIAEQASAVLGMDKMDIPGPRWVTNLNAVVDKATAAAGIGLTKTITDAMAASASTVLGMDKVSIPGPRWVTDLNAVVDSAQLRAADQLLTGLQSAMNVDRPQVAWSGSLADRTGELLSSFSNVPAEEVAGAAVAASEVLDDPGRQAVLQRAASSAKPSGWTSSQQIVAAVVILVALDVVLPLKTGATAETIYGNILQTLIVALALAACLQGPRA
jgi:hypothetical protein